MATAAELLKTLITAHAGTSGWQIEIGAMPDSPNRVIMLTDTGSWDDPWPNYALDFPTVQVLVRGNANGYQAAQDELKAVKDICLGVTSGKVGTDNDWLTSVLVRGDASFVGRDDEMRPLFSVNFALIVEPADDPNSNRTVLSGGTLGFDSGFASGFG